MSKITKAEERVAKYSDKILKGHMLVVDPSCGSSSSLPGYAIFKEGKLEETGVIELHSINGDLYKRLREIAKCFDDMFGEFDILVIEAIPPVHGGNVMGKAKSHASLLKSVGAIVGSVDATRVVDIHPRTWQKYKDKDYVKADDQDAKYIGYAAIAIALKQVERKEKAKGLN